MRKTLTRSEFLRGALSVGAALALARFAVAQESAADLLPRRILGEQTGAAGEKSDEKGPVVTALAMHPSEKRLASAGDDHAVRIWDVDQGSVLQSLTGHTDWVRAVAYSPDGQRLVTVGNDRRLIAWNAEDGSRIAEKDLSLSGVAGIAYHPSGETLAVVGFQAEALILDAATFEVATKLATPSTDVRTVRFSPDGRRMAAGGRDGVVRIWDLAAGSSFVDATGHSGRVRGLAFTAAGTEVYSVGEDGELRLARVDAAGASELVAAVGCKLQSLCRVREHYLAAGGSDNLVHLWDSRTRQEIEALTGHTGSVAALCSGETTLVSGGFDAAVRLWDLADVLPDGAATAVVVPPAFGGPAFSTSSVPGELRP